MVNGWRVRISAYFSVVTTRRVEMMMGMTAGFWLKAARQSLINELNSHASPKRKLIGGVGGLVVPAV